MSNFAEKLRTKGKVEEDRYFAKRDRELLRAMKKDRLAKVLDVGGKKKKKACSDVEKDFDKSSKRYKKKQGKLVRAYRKLLKKAKKI